MPSDARLSVKSPFNLKKTWEGVRFPGLKGPVEPLKPVDRFVVPLEYKVGVLKHVFGEFVP